MSQMRAGNQRDKFALRGANYYTVPLKTAKFKKGDKYVEVRVISLEGVPIHLLISFCNAEELSGNIIVQKLFLTLIFPFLIVLGFNNTSTLVGHFVLSSREREMRDRRYSRGDEREGQGRKRNRNESKKKNRRNLSKCLEGHEYPRPAPFLNYKIF